MAKLLSAVFYCALSVWIGASVMRLVVGYDAFIPGTTTLKDWYTQPQLAHDMWLYTLMAGWTGWSFAIMTIGGLGSLLLQRSKWKSQAWMVMIVLFLILLIPAQTWIIMRDIELWSYFNPATSLPSSATHDLTGIFVERMTGITYSVINGLSILMGLTIVATLAVRPLAHHD